MSMADSGQPMKPQDQIIYLLGELTGKVTALQSSVDTSQSSQAATNAAMAASIASLRSDVDVLKAKMPTRTPWFSIVGGISGIGAIVLSAITLLNLVTQ
jgi:hypothetical protein